VPPLHVAQVSFFVDPQRRAPQALLRDWFPLVDVAAAVASVGNRVTVIQASTVTGTIVQAGATFHFVAPEPAGSLLAHSRAFRALLHELAPDVLHVHGLGFGHEVRALHELAPSTPILLQDHADRVPRFWRRRAWRSGAVAASGLSFCARGQAEPFRRARLLPPDVEIFEIPELTSQFTPGDTTRARAATGLHGDPAILWVGHLNANKDPLAVLDGVSAAASELPNLKLWCCYATAPLLPAVEARVARDATLRDRVHLLGRVPRGTIEELMRAADLFVLGSHREGGSSALVEAMATGLTPVVTDIPSSRALTGNGAVGALWPCGDAQAFTSALQSTAATLGPEARAHVRAHFEAQLAGPALGRKLTAAYGRLLQRQVPETTHVVAS
jgi:glycosyltransferase involved in cell wall biosynthesis